jgi:hypothetical protein
MPRETERYTALLRTMTGLVRAPDVPASLALNAEQWLMEGGLGQEDTAPLAELGAHRLQTYRRHVRRTIARAIGQRIPRTVSRFGEGFSVWVDRWIEEELSRSPYLRDVAFELCAWCLPRWADDPSVPSYLGDLARHELVSFEVGCALDDESLHRAPALEIALDHRVRFTGSARLVRYQHVVHRLRAALDARDIPERAPTALLAYRHADFETRFLELTPLAAAFLDRLIAGATLEGAVRSAAAGLAVDVDPTVTGGIAALLDDLRNRGVILGGEA